MSDPISQFINWANTTGNNLAGPSLSTFGFGAPTTGPFSSSNYTSPMTNSNVLNYAGNAAQSNGTGTTDLNSLYAMLQQQANGQGPNLAGAQAMASGQAAQKGMLSALGSQRGLSPGQAAAMAANQGAGLQGQAIQSGAQATLAQQLAAMQQMAGVGNSIQQNAQFNAGSYNNLLSSLYGNMNSSNIANNNNIYGAYNNGMNNLSGLTTKTIGGLANAGAGISGMSTSAFNGSVGGSALGALGASI